MKMTHASVPPTHLLLAIFVAIFVSADLFAQRAGQSVTIQTGRVVGAQAVNLQSAAGRGAAVGGILGYATTSSNRSSSRRARNTLIGAAAGGIMTSRAEGNLDGMQYTVEVASGARIQVVTDQTEIKIGDCVNVEQAGAGTANVRRVSSSLCDSPNVEPDIAASFQEEADRCLQAKDRLLDAETEAEIEAAIRRVEILCDD